MNKQGLIAKVVEVTGLKKGEAESAVNATFDAITQALVAGEEVSIPGFGKLESRPTAARKARNMHTGEEIEVAASRKPAFKPAKALKDAIKQ